MRLAGVLYSPSPRTTAALNAYAFGFLTLTGSNGHVVRSPIAVKPVPLSAPATVSGSGAAGNATFSITTGYDGTWASAVRGLIPADKRAGNVAQDPDSTFDTTNPDSNGAPGTTRHDYTVPAGTTYARSSLFDENDGATDDLDMYVYRVNANGTKTLVGVSGGGTARREVNLVDPAAATYNVYVHGWQTDGPDTNYNLFGWVLGTANAQANATLTPSSARRSRVRPRPSPSAGPASPPAPVPRPHRVEQRGRWQPGGGHAADDDPRRRLARLGTTVRTGRPAETPASSPL